MEDNKYCNSKIYKIVSATHPEVVYVGSTVNPLNKRLVGHRTDYNRGIRIASNQVMQYADAEIILVEEYPCDNSNELRMREEFWRRDLKAINYQQCYTTREEYLTKKKEWHLANIDKRQQERQRETEKRQQRTQIERDIILEKRRQLYRLKKEKVRPYIFDIMI